MARTTEDLVTRLNSTAEKLQASALVLAFPDGARALVWQKRRKG